MLNNCGMHRHTGPAPGIKVWGGIGYHSRTTLIPISRTLNSQRYISEVLEPVVLPYLQGLPIAIFQQDNARPHVSSIIQRFFVNRQIELPSLQARSPELSPKENMWPRQQPLRANADQLRLNTPDAKVCSTEPSNSLQGLIQIHHRKEAQIELLYYMQHRTQQQPPGSYTDSPQKESRDRAPILQSAQKPTTASRSDTCPVATLCQAQMKKEEGKQLQDGQGVIIQAEDPSLQVGGRPMMVTASQMRGLTQRQDQYRWASVRPLDPKATQDCWAEAECGKACRSSLTATSAL
ncbi:hypothetical protein LAZ67_18002134 [Cordylochernes scorpioides]|uniref:Transposase n=1 Tax=Cordylochernes scorpioides TaxID=51811 RepID=A0ABY6LGP4_9ARAC|nr:hypothetical protein LAZ67_18002134 [Cordylochernes scorpioides]